MLKNPHRFHRSWERPNLRGLASTTTWQFCLDAVYRASLVNLEPGLKPCLVTEVRSEKDTGKARGGSEPSYFARRVDHHRSSGLAVLKAHQTNLKKSSKYRGTSCSQNRD